MQIIFESREADGHQMRESSVARVRFALRRLSGVVIASSARDWRTALDNSDE